MVGGQKKMLSASTSTICRSPTFRRQTLTLSRKNKQCTAVGAGTLSFSVCLCLLCLFLSLSHPLCFVGVHHVVQLRPRLTAVELGRDDARRRLGSGLGEVLALFFLEGKVEPPQRLPLLAESQLSSLVAVWPQVEGGKSGFEAKRERERREADSRQNEKKRDRLRQNR